MNKIPRGLIVFHRHGHRAPGRNVILSKFPHSIRSGIQNAIEYDVAEITLWKGFCDPVLPLLETQINKRLIPIDQLYSIIRCKIPSSTENLSHFLQQNVAEEERLQYSLGELQFQQPSDALSYPFGNLTVEGVKCLQTAADALVQQFPVLYDYDLLQLNGILATSIVSTNYKRTQVGFLYAYANAI
jgi:hypothetical protein